MNEIKVNTNLHCGACETRLAKSLNADERISHWSANLTLPGKPVTIHGNLEVNEAIELIRQAGFTASTLSVAHKQEPFSWSDRSTWKKAGRNTFNCLLGCSIGDFGMIIFLQAFYPATPMWMQMILAIMAGLITSVALETFLLHNREKLAWKPAFQMAISMSFISMVAMEVVMNLTDFMITGGKMALTSPAYWFAFLPAALAGFLAPLPYNYYKLRKYNKSCH